MPEIRHAPHASTEVLDMPAGSVVDPHWHDAHQIVYAGRGVLSVTTDAGSWIAPATRAIWVPAGTVHEHRAFGDTALHTLGLDVNPLRLDSPAVLGVSPLLRELILAYTRRPRADGPERRRLRGVLLDQLRHSPTQAIHLPAGRDPRLVAVCGMLHENPADGRDLAALGARAGASARTLSRLFRAELGMTFPQWRTQLRLHRALVLLAEGEPVTAVAHRCGWASTSAFIDVFRAVFGATPGAYRRES